MRRVVFLCHLLLFLWLFGEVIFLPNSFAFRDSAHFYYPLFSLVQSEWEAGRIPLWNPYENSGTPLLASATSSVFYPGKLIFFLPIPFAAAFKIYILAHLALAGATAYSLARRWGLSIAAAGLASLSYAYSGNVMFQCYNVVFLCGAAWLPLAVLTGHTMLAQRSVYQLKNFAAVLAMLVLAGDPQMAYLAGLLVALYALILGKEIKTNSESIDENENSSVLKPHPATDGKRRFQPNRFGLLIAAALVGGCLSAIQILPTLEFSRMSTRATLVTPRNLYEIPAYAERKFKPIRRTDTGKPPKWYDTLMGNPPPQTGHQKLNYAFSIPPWNFAEFLWPNFTGQYFPVNHRWTRLFGKDLGTWVPSNYMGLLPFLLAIGAMRFWRGDRRAIWLSWIVLIAILASMGIYAPGMAIKQLFPELEKSLPFGYEFGGVYWLFTVLLPGFYEFRYPAKFMVVAAFGLSMLAAQKWDTLCLEQRSPNSRLVVLTGVLGLAVLTAMLVFAGAWAEGVKNIMPSPHYGPLDVEGAYQDVMTSLAQSLILCGTTFTLFRLAARKGSVQSGKLSVAILVMTTLDLGIANHRLVVSAPSREWETAPKLAELVHEAHANRTGNDNEPVAPIRFYRIDAWDNEEWSYGSSINRQAEWLRWHHDTLFPKFHLAQGLDSVVSPGTLELYDYGLYMSTVPRAGGNEYVRPRRALDIWGTEYFIVSPKLKPTDSSLTTVGLHNKWLEPQWKTLRPQGTPMGGPLPSALTSGSKVPAELGEMQILYNESHFPRTWIVRDVRVRKPIPPGHIRAISAVMRPIVFPVNRWTNLRKTAIVESASLREQRRARKLRLPQKQYEGESSRISNYSPQSVELEVTLKARGYVVLSDIFYPGWHATVSSNGGPWKQTEIFRTNRIMRGILLPEGQHRVRFEYLPQSFYTGAALSGASWFLFLILHYFETRRASGRLPLR